MKVNWIARAIIAGIMQGLAEAAVEQEAREKMGKRGAKRPKRKKAKAKKT